jgi:hypothetical protein
VAQESVFAVYEGTVRRAWVSRSGWLVIETEKPKPVAFRKWVGKLPPVGARVSVEASEGDFWYFAKHRDAADITTQGMFDLSGLANADGNRAEIVAQMVLNRLAKEPQVVGDDVIEEAQKRFPGVDGRFIGHGFRLLASQGKIHRVGYRRSSRKKIHASDQAVWELTKP